MPRSKRNEQCDACHRRKRTRGHATCKPCRDEMASYSSKRYDERRDAGRCVRCFVRTGLHGDRRDPMLCEATCAPERRLRRQKGG